MISSSNSSETAFSLETDKRGTHLRVRKMETIQRRTRRALAVAASILLSSVFAEAQFTISTNTTGAFAPSFRNTTTPDGGNTTWFGWTGNNDGVSAINGSLDDGGFDGTIAGVEELIDNPPVIISPLGSNGSLFQYGTADILAGSNNIFAGDANNQSVTAFLKLQIPTNGVPGGDGFTTIILQGTGSVTGGGAQVPFVPGPINGVNPTYVSGVSSSPNSGANAPGNQQWWAKYNIPGNAASYSVDIIIPGGTGVNPGSLRVLTVDTQYSTTGYATDSAISAPPIPEPGSMGLLLSAGLVLLARRRR